MKRQVNVSFFNIYSELEMKWFKNISSIEELKNIEENPYPFEVVECKP